MKNASLAILSLALLLVSSAFVVAPPAHPGAASTAVFPAGTQTFTLYGDAADGWGTTRTNINNPGPSLTVTVGDTVTIHLYSNDTPIQHTWFIDFDNNNVNGTGEPSSPVFSSATTAVDFTFTVPSGHIGTFTYKCRFHPTTMTGSITIQATPPPPTFTLYGSASLGWGFASTSLSNPGPALNVDQGQTVTIDLYSADSATHNLYIDWNANGRQDVGVDSISASFSSATNPVRFSFVASQAGSFTYECNFHGTAMRGTLHVAASGSSTPTNPDYTLYAAVIIVVVIVAIAVGVLMKRKPRSPPQPPPQQP